MRYFVDPPPEMEENFVFPCGVCGKRVGKRMRAIKCNLCNYWNHIKCDGVEPTHYETLKKSDIIYIYHKSKCYTKRLIHLIVYTGIVN